MVFLHLLNLRAELSQSLYSTTFLILKKKKWKILISGGGRKNQFLIDRIKQKTTKNITIKSIDDHGLNGDFVESQAFAYLAIRSYIGEIISFPKTTGCLKPCSGGQIIKVT